MPDPTDDDAPKRPTFRARMSKLLWPPGSPESQTAIHHPSGLKAATEHSVTAPTHKTSNETVTVPSHPDPAPPEILDPNTEGYVSYVGDRAGEPVATQFDLRADNIAMVAAAFTAQQAGSRTSSRTVEVTLPEQALAASAAKVTTHIVRDDEQTAAPEVTQDRRDPEPPRAPDRLPPAEPQQAALDGTTSETRDLSGREGQAASSARFAALKPEAAIEKVGALDAWAAAQIPIVARQHFEMWREADVAAVHAVEHMQANVPDHSRDVKARLTGLATEVRHGFHQARTGLDLIEDPTPATLSAFMANAHHEDTPDLLKTATPQEVSAIVIADSAALNADMGDSIDALDAAISDLAQEEAARAPAGASVIAPANDSGAKPIVRDERPTFQDLTDARLDDINAILEEARGNDNRPGAAVATILTAAAAQTFHRIAGMDGMEADTPEHERAVEATSEDISSLIATVADAREVHVTESEFADVLAQDETALAAMLALSSPSAEGSSQEASADDARHLADFEALSGEMTDAKWSRADAHALAQMEEMSDYKAEATEKNASRARNSTERGGGMDR